MNASDVAYLTSIIDSKIKRALESISLGLYGSIKETDGYFATIEVKSSSASNLKPIKKVPILQSKWHNPISSKGDEGVLINLGVDIGSQVMGTPLVTDTTGRTYWVFLPLCKKAERAKDASTMLLTSEKSQTSIEFSDEGYKLEATKPIEFTTKDSFSLETTKDTSITATGNITGEATQSLSLKGTKEVTIEGTQVSVKSSTPLEVGSEAGTIGDVFQELLNQLQTAFTTPAAPGSPICPAWAGLSAMITAKLKTVLK